MTSVKDIRSNLRLLIANLIAITGNGTTNGADIDTQEAQGGIMFSMACLNFTDGVYDVVIEESVDAAFTSPVVVTDANRLIGTIAGMQLDAESANDDVVPTIGVIGGLRYKRCNVVASGVTTGADIVVIAILGIDHMPSAEPDAAAS